MIPVLTEPGFANTYWCSLYMQGIGEEARRRGGKAQAVSFEELGPGPVIVLGSSPGWIRSCLDYLASRNIPSVAAGAPPGDRYCSFSAPDYEDAAARFLNMCAAAQPQGRALFAFNPDSAADQIKKTAFAGLCPEGAVIKNSGGLLASCQAFLRNIAQYGAVLCTNDVAAMVLVRLLRARKEEAPLIFAYGDQRLPPEESIGIFLLDFVQAGRQAVQLYREVEKENNPGRRILWVPCPPEVPFALPGTPEEAQQNAPSPSGEFYQDPQVHEMFRFKKLLARCDGLDIDILRELGAGSRYFDMAERLHTTENTIKYRLKRMMTLAGAQSRDELLQMALEGLGMRG